MIGERKDEHVRLASAQQTGPMASSEFDEVEILHHALAGIDRAHVRLDTEVAGLHWPVPLYINAMTGGSEQTAEINRSLAIAAAATGVPIACGSMSVAFRHPETAEGFRVLRRENPDGFVMANLSAEASGETAARAVDMLEADALQLHLNAVQETVMPEGSRDFSAWPAAIEEIVAAVPVPVIVKEVGFGLSRRTLTTLAGLGVRIADVSGGGGTNFARIENERRGGDYHYLDAWGQSTVSCLLDGADAPLTLLASGGIRHPLDVVRALALGAKGVGASGVFLQAVLDGGADRLTALLEEWLERLAELLALVGARRPHELTGVDLLLRGRVREYCTLRGLDAGAYARRSEAVTKGDR